MPLRSRKLAEAFLEEISRAGQDGDIETIVGMAAIPYRRLTQTHDMLIESDADCRRDVVAYLDNLEALGTDLAHRRVREARPFGGRYIEFIYETQLLSKGRYVIQPFETRMVLLRKPEGFKMIELEWSLETFGWTSGFRVNPIRNLGPLSFGREDIRGYGLDPMASYQTHLDAIAKSEIERDFETYCSYLRFPHTAHSMQMDNIFKNPEDVWPFYDMIQRTFNGEVGDRLERTCDWAEFLGSDLLVGYHTGRVYKNGVEVIEPVTSRMILQLNDDRWQLLSVANTIKNKQYPFDMYAPGDKLLTDLDIQKRTIEWPSFLRKRTPAA